MNFWDFSAWGFFNLMAVLLASLLTGNMLKRSVPVLQASLIPTSVLGGGILIVVAGIYKLFTGNIMFDEPSQTPYYKYYSDGKEHIVWFEDARSVNARMELVNSYGLAGMSIWNIMNFYRPLFTTINSYFLPDK